MIRVVLDLDVPMMYREDVQAFREKVAMDFEKYSDVHIVEVREITPEQMKLEG